MSTPAAADPDRVDPNRVDPNRSGTMIASDLDRTLIYSPSALQLPTVPHDTEVINDPP